MENYDKELNDLKIIIRHLLAVKQSDLAEQLRKQPFQQRADVSKCPSWAIQFFAEYLLSKK